MCEILSRLQATKKPEADPGWLKFDTLQKGLSKNNQYMRRSIRKPIHAAVRRKETAPKEEEQ